MKRPPVDKPVHILHDRILLSMSAHSVRFLRTLLKQEAAIKENDMTGVVVTDTALGIYHDEMIKTDEWQEFLDTINTAFDKVGCGAAECHFPDGHPPVEL